MGDVRYESEYRQVLESANRLEAIRELSDEGVIRALADASRAADPLLANVLAEEAMARMRRVRAISATLPEGLLVLDADARLSYLNEGAMRLFGVARSEAVGRQPMDLIDRLDAEGNAVPRVDWTASRTLASGDVLRDEAWFRRRSDGALFSASFVVTPLVHDDEVVGAVALFSDTTIQKAAAEEQDAELKALAAVARHTPDLLTRATPDGRIFWASPSAHAVLGIAPKALVGRSFGELAHPDDVAHLEQIRSMAMEPNMPPLEAIFRARREDGSYVWLHARLQAVVGATGAVEELVTSTRPLHPRPGRERQDAGAVRLARRERD